MSEDLLYNRDRNFSGISNISIGNYAPSYGSNATFRSTSFNYKTDDNYYNLIPSSLNSLILTFEMRYEVNETDAQKLANFFESKSGVYDFEFQADSGVYKNLTGVCEGYSIGHLNNQHYELSATIDVAEAPNLMNWSGGNFVANAWTPYADSTSYQKYDVVYTGVNGNKLNNFYYCTGDHTSSASTSPTGANSMWTQEFFFEPDLGASNDVRFDVDMINFKNSFKDRAKNRNNIALVPISYTFKSITTKQLKAMLHFLENKGGYRRFRHQIPSVYNKPKVFYCPEWKHEWQYHNSHNLSVMFVEDPLGIIPTGT